MYDYDFEKEDELNEVRARVERKRNKRSLRKLTKESDFVLYTSPASEFDISEVTGNYNYNIGFSDNY
jgi:putative NADH-flavin reductase